LTNGGRIKESRLLAKRNYELADQNKLQSMLRRKRAWEYKWWEDQHSTPMGFKAGHGGKRWGKASSNSMKEERAEWKPGLQGAPW